jgi:hypothetical protein
MEFRPHGALQFRGGRYFLAPSVAGGSSSGEYTDVAGRGGKLKMKLCVLIRYRKAALFCLLGQGAGMALAVPPLS